MDHHKLWKILKEMGIPYIKADCLPSEPPRYDFFLNHIIQNSLKISCEIIVLTPDFSAWVVLIKFQSFKHSYNLVQWHIKFYVRVYVRNTLIGSTVPLKLN